jgi:hypothetical protein
LDISATVDNLQLANGNTLNFNDNTRLTVDGSSILNAGSLTLNSGGNATELIIGGANVTLSGGGTLTLSDSGNPQNFILGAASTNTLTNQETIQGSGNIGDGQMGLVNSGTINANNADHGLVIQTSSGFTNTGRLEATNGATLVLRGDTYNNKGGKIQATGGGVVQLYSSNTIQGGTLTTSGTGSAIETVSGDRSITLDGTTKGILTNAGSFVVVDNSTAFVKGTINNTGSMALNSGGNAAFLELSSNTTLTGPGTVTLADSSNPQNFILGASGSDILTNPQTIQGSGNIGDGQMGLVNSGTINANNADHGLVIQTSSGVTNTGTMEATNGATLVLRGDTYNNKGGKIQAAGGGVVQLYNGNTIQGGTLTTSGTGSAIETVGGDRSITLDGTSQGTLTNSGSFVVVDNSTAFVKRTINNTHSIALNSGGNGTFLELSGNTSLQGGGTLTLTNSGNPQNFILGQVDTFKLTNVNNTISGAGTIGNGSMVLVNQAGGVIDANVAGRGLTISVSGNGVGTGVNGTNTGVLESTAFNTTTGASVLLLNAGTINNNGGTIQATGGGVVELYNGFTVQGGTLTTDSGKGSVIQTVGGDRSITLDGTSQGTLTNSGSFVVVDNSTAFLKGTINNTGSMAINSGGNFAALELNGNVTLTGTGTVTLADSGNPQNFILGASGSDILTNPQTIQGSGNIGDGQMGLVNSGTIDANNADHGLGIQTSSGVTNTGTLEATNGATLVLRGDTYNNRGGKIQATGGGVVQLYSSNTIQGGTLTTSGTGSVIETVGGDRSITLDGTTKGILTNAGSFAVVDNSTAFLKGTINNTGSMALNSGGNQTDLRIEGPVTLQGGGALILTDSGNPQNFIFAVNGTDTLTNKNNLIEGSGNVGDAAMGLINSGTIEANNADHGLVIQTSSSGFINNGTLKVASGSFMHVLGGPFTNFAGTTLTGGTYNVTGTLEIDELGSTGGEIVSNAANIILNTPASSFVDAAGKNALSNLAVNAAAGKFTLSGGQNFTTVGNFTNNGTLTVGSGSTFKVPTGKRLTNFSGTTLTGGTYNVSGTLKFPGANIVTNAANITLTGTSSKILNATGANGLANFATNAAGAGFTINGRANFTTAGAFTNSGTLTVGSTSTFNSASGNYSNAGTTTVQKGGTFTGAGTLSNTGTLTNGGTLQAANAATLDLKGGTYANTGGTILAAGTSAQVLIDGATISGGTLTSNTGGVLVAKNSATLNGATNAVTISAGSSLQVNNGQTLQTVGTLTNNGTLSLNSTGTNTELVLTGNLTLGGTGSLTLSNNAANVISATAATDVLTNSSTIQGSGNVGNGAMGVVNNKTITANQSTPLIVDTSSTGFSNTGTLNVSTGDTLQITGGPFANLSGTTLTGGTYNVTGTLQYNSTSDIATNGAAITLNGSAAKIIDSNSHNALSGLARNTSSGTFTVKGGQSLADSATAFSNAGTMTVGKGSKFTLSNAAATYTQTAGTTTVDGILTAKGGMTFSGGSLFGNGGTLNAGTNMVKNSATFNIGDKTLTAGAESITGTYTQSSPGVLNTDIGGTTAKTQFDRLTISSAASLNGTLNLDLINSFVPTVGETFDILNASSVGGTFSTVTGTAINSSEHFTVVYNPTNVTLDVVSGAATTAFLGKGRPGPTSATPEPSTLLLLGSGLLLVGHYARRRAAGRRRRLP